MEAQPAARNFNGSTIPHISGDGSDVCSVFADLLYIIELAPPLPWPSVVLVLSLHRIPSSMHLLAWLVGPWAVAVALLRERWERGCWVVGCRLLGLGDCEA